MRALSTWGQLIFQYNLNNWTEWELEAGKASRCFTCTRSLMVICLITQLIFNAGKMEFTITKQWDGTELTHDAIILKMESHCCGLKLSVSAPFFNDPPAPSVSSGQPCPQLWDYEGMFAHFHIMIMWHLSKHNSFPQCNWHITYYYYLILFESSNTRRH